MITEGVLRIADADPCKHAWQALIAEYTRDKMNTVGVLLSEAQLVNSCIDVTFFMWAL